MSLQVAAKSTQFFFPKKQRKISQHGGLTRTVMTTQSQKERKKSRRRVEKKNSQLSRNIYFGSLAVMKMKLFNISRAVDGDG